MSSIYASFISFVYLGLFYLRFQDVSSAIWLGLGFILGMAILEFDELIAHRWYNESTEPYLITRSTFFLLIYLPLAIFILTSSGSIVGRGLILGIGFLIWVEMLLLFRQPTAFKKRFLSQVAVPITQENIQYVMVATTICLMVLAMSSLW